MLATLCCACLLLAATSVPALAQRSVTVRDQVAHTILVGFSDQTRREIAHDIRRVNGSMIRFLGKGEAVQLQIRGPVGAAVRALRGDPGVRFVEVVRRVGSATAASDSSQFGQQWSLRNTGQFAGSVVASDVDATQAWQLVGAGSRDVLVGSVDSGVAFSLPALAGLNLWTNTGEVVGGTSDGDDDDESFCVDDVYGCDFVNDDGDPTDDDGHGTATVDVMMGPWGASPAAGIAPGVTLITAKALDASGAGTTAEEAAAINYVAERGARVVNISIGGPYSAVVEDAIADHPDTLFLVAAGNVTADDDYGPGASYPCASPQPNVVCVAASTASDGLAPFSNTGARTVDLAAPGQQIVAIGLNGGLLSWNGTSFSAPMATATAALALSIAPSATTAQLRRAILGGVESRPAFRGSTVTGGRLNAYYALQLILGRAVGGRLPYPSPSADPAAPPVPPTPAARSPTRVVRPTTVHPTASGAVVVRGRAQRRRGNRLELRLACTSVRRCSGSAALSRAAAGSLTHFSIGAGASRRILVGSAPAPTIRRTALLVRAPGRPALSLTVRIAASRN